MISVFEIISNWINGYRRRGAARLLCENLTAAQRRSYEKGGCFDVAGGSTGKHYRIHYGSSMNVEEIAANGERIDRLCFFPQGHICPENVMLAQKLALELFEVETLAIANRAGTHLRTGNAVSIDHVFGHQ